MKSVELACRSKRQGIIGLPQAYAVGIDIKFLVDAYVIIYARDKPDTELFFQMLGRGSRRMGDYKGTLFTERPIQEAEGVKQSFFAEPQNDYLDGAKIIKTINYMLSKLDTDEKKTKLIKTTGGVWKQEYETFYSKLFEYMKVHAKQFNNAN